MRMRLLMVVLGLWATLGWAQDGGVVGDRRLNCVRRLARVAGVSWRDRLNALKPGDDPQALVASWLAPTADDTNNSLFNNLGFSRSFASFFAGKVNREPPTSSQEGFYAYAADWVLHHERPWKTLFAGKFSCVSAGTTTIACADDPQLPGLGIYNSELWRNVYVGASEGPMLRGAYNIIRATTGRVINPSAANMTGDNSATGRQRPECQGCHYSGPYALDHLAALLPWKRNLTTNRPMPQTPTPQTLFTGQTFASAEAVLAYITESEAFQVWTCQLLFEYATGRPARACEWQPLVACTQVMKASGQLREAILPIITDPAFCSEDP